jgi:hypothetical protein
MSVLKETIVNEYGDAAFVTAISSQGSSTAPTIRSNKITNMNKAEGQSKSKFDQLVHTFTLHSTLRRKLLNRLARRLHRVSHAMDTFVSSHSAPSTLAIHAPLPPSYGDIVRRYVSTNIEKNGIAHQLLGGTLDHVKIIRQVDVMEYNTKMNEIDTMKEILEECARTNNYSRVDNYINGEEEKDEGEEEEEEQDDTSATTSSPPPPLIMSEVDSILQKEMKCQPLYTKMAEYELSNGYYDKVYHITPPPSNNNNDNDGNEKKETTVNIVKTINPLINTMDDHEVNDDGNFIINTTTTTNKKGGEQSNNNNNITQQQQHHRLPFVSTGTLVPTVRTVPPKERVNEWKRWTKEICDRISDQITFSELIIMREGGGGGSSSGSSSVGGPQGHVFNLEGRMKRKSNDDATVVTNGGKVPRMDNDDQATAVVVAAAEDVVMGSTEGTKVDDDADATAATKEEMNANDKKGQDTTLTTTSLPTKSFSVMPVPSFYYQDLKRIRNIHTEMVRSLQSHNTRGRIIGAQLEYDAAYKKSIDLQQAKMKQQILSPGIRIRNP